MSFSDIKSNINKIFLHVNKITILLFLMLFFSLLYMLLDDSHFEGVNKFKEIVKEEVIKEKVKQEISENFENFQGSEIIKEKTMDEATKESEEEVKETILEPEKVDPSLFDKYLNRLYFAIVSGCLLGYGDIYPVTNISKFVAGLQGLLTVSLILY